MSRLAKFFRDADSDTGVFYPKHYLVAVFANLAEAEAAKLHLRYFGRLDDDLISAPGVEVVRLAAAHLLNNGLWGVLMTALSRTIGTEVAYADGDIEAAKAGAAFVAVRCLNERAKAKAWRALEPRHPLAARYYASGGIEHLAGEI